MDHLYSTHSAVFKQRCACCIYLISWSFIYFLLHTIFVSPTKFLYLDRIISSIVHVCLVKSVTPCLLTFAYVFFFFFKFYLHLLICMFNTALYYCQVTTFSLVQIELHKGIKFWEIQKFSFCIYFLLISCYRIF